MVTCPYSEACVSSLLNACSTVVELNPLERDTLINNEKRIEKTLQTCQSRHGFNAVGRGEPKWE